MPDGPRELSCRSRELFGDLLQCVDVALARHEHTFWRGLPAHDLKQLPAQGLQTVAGFGGDHNAGADRPARPPAASDLFHTSMMGVLRGSLWPNTCCMCASAAM